MGVDTKIHILLTDYNVGETISRVKKVIAAKMKVFGEVESRQTGFPEKYNEDDPNSRYRMTEMHSIEFALDYHCPEYESGKEQRSLFVCYDHFHQEQFLYLSMGRWGHCEDIAKCLVDAFGGYADFNDCDSIAIDYAKAQPKTKEPKRKAKHLVK